MVRVELSSCHRTGDTPMIGLAIGEVLNRTAELYPNHPALIVRKLFHQLDGWIRQRVSSHRFNCWRCRGCKKLSIATLYGEYGLVNLVRLIPSIAFHQRLVFVKAAYGKTVRAV